MQLLQGCGGVGMGGSLELRERLKRGAEPAEAGLGCILGSRLASLRGRLGGPEPPFPDPAQLMSDPSQFQSLFRASQRPFFSSRCPSGCTPVFETPQRGPPSCVLRGHLLFPLPLPGGSGRKQHDQSQLWLVSGKQATHVAAGFGPGLGELRPA